MLLGVKINKKLNFDRHISKICKRTRNNKNAISRIQKYLCEKSKETLLNTLVTANLNYCPLAWHFSFRKSLKKVEKIQ